MITCKVAVILLLVVCCRGQVSVSPAPTLVVREGENGQFTCEGNGGPMVLQVNSNVSYALDIVEEGDGTSTVYEIDTVQRSDNGTTIQCFSNAQGSNIITLLVDFPPLYSPNVLDYVIIEGSSPRVQLTLDAAPRITSFEWIRNGERIQGDSRRVLFSDAIVFDSISRDDIGTYRVIATDNLGSGQATINIDVYYPPEFLDGEGSVNRSVVTGQDITLDCSVVDANPPITNLTLAHDLTGSVTNVEISDDAFVITGATGANAGLYTCTATNLIAVTTIAYNLLVGELPDVEFLLTIEVMTTLIVIDAEFTDNSAIPVEYFIITIGNATYTVAVDQFPLQLNITTFSAGDHTVIVEAVNDIGAIEVGRDSFNVPEPPTSGAIRSSLAISMIIMCILAFLNNN